jgi:hypothetical protein
MARADVESASDGSQRTAASAFSYQASPGMDQALSILTT